MDLVYNVDGARGYDGSDGFAGSSGLFAGSDGSDGGDAGPASPGEDGGSISLALATVGEVLRVTGRCVSPGGGAREVEDHAPLERLGDIVVRAVGGDGGHGGDGGRGGDGATGASGRDATRYSSGGDGGPGGDGGDGGRGTDGADGGDGGEILLVLGEYDTYLLMAVDGLDAPAPLVAPGRGGAAGHHGSGGSGGWGGSGGSSYSWTETEWDTVTRTDMNGNSRTERVSRTVHHSNPGGSRGFSGSSGHTPTWPLSPGADGAPGDVTLCSVTPDGAESRWPSRYDLELVSFSVIEDDGDDKDGIFEFGEIALATDLVVKNVGGMPTPPHQRIRLLLAEGVWVEPLGETLHLTETLLPGETRAIPGALRFRIRPPTEAPVGPPRVEHEDVRPLAFQRGVEDAHGDTLFSRRYAHVVTTRELEARYPVENTDGVVALRSLAAGERTRYRFAVTNISRLPIGSATPRGRRITLQIALVGGDLRPEQVVLRDAAGDRVPVEGVRDGLAGLVVDLPRLDPGATFTLEGTVGVAHDALPYQHATLHATIHLAEVLTGRRVATQHRELTLRVEPAFRFDLASEFVFVAQNATSREAYLAWQALCNERLGVTADVWSLTRYGHCDMREPLEDGTTLRLHTEGRVVVVLNQPFNPTGTEDTDLPSDYIAGRDFREGATVYDQHWLVLGEREGFAWRTLLEPTAAEALTGDAYPSAKAFLRTAAKSGGTLVEETFQDDLTLHIDQVPLTAWTFPFLRGRLRHMARAAQRLSEGLSAAHPGRRYVIVIPDLPEPEKVGRTWCGFPRWRLGTADVRRTLNTETSSGLLLLSPAELLNAPSYIGSPQVRFALLLALAFEKKLERLAWLLHDTPELDDEGRLTLSLLVKAIVVDLAEEQAALRSGRGPTDAAACDDKLANLGRLLRFPLDAALALTSNKWPHLAALCAALEELAASQKAWWMLWGRNRRVTRYVLDKARLLRSEWFDARFFTDTGDATVDGGTAGEAIDERREGLRLDCRARRTVLREDGVRVSYRQAAMSVFTSPDDVGFSVLTRDIDVWRDPEARVWTRSQLAMAAEAEAERQAKRDALEDQNAAARADLFAGREPAPTAPEEEAKTRVEDAVTAA